MIDYEQLKAAIDTKLSTDPEFRTIMKRVTAGRATFIDTSRYSEVIAHALGQELSKYVLELTDREAITKQLLHDNYEDINDVFGRVQRDIDKKKGLTLKPQQAPFPEERVEQYAHSLLDPTVEDNVIKRRARAGSETITKSFHDDCIEKNAEFHEEAGLKCYIIRMGTNCCQWCSDVAGKYEMKNQPEGIFRRHDNCNCTIIYDGQVLRGQAGNNGKSSKKWVEVSNSTGAAEAPRLSQEQARKLDTEKTEKNTKSITAEEREELLSRNKLGIRDNAVFNEKAVSHTNNDYSINTKNINTKEYTDKYSGIGKNPTVDNSVKNEAISILNHRDGTPYEDLSLINYKTGKVEVSIRKPDIEHGIMPNEEYKRFLSETKENIIALHNHPSSVRPSISDILTTMGYDRKKGEIVHSCIKKSVISCHNGKIYIIDNVKHNKTLAQTLDKEYKNVYNYIRAANPTSKNIESYAAKKAMDAVLKLNEEISAFSMKEL